MARREAGAGSTKRARKQTPAEVAAGSANLAKGRAAKAAQARAAKAAGKPRAKVRWQQLLDGTITVKDLDDDEIAKMRVRGADGGFAGQRKAIPSHLAQQFHREALRRAQQKINVSIPKVVQGLLDIAQDPDAKDSDRIRAYTLLMERGMGRVPEVIRIEGESGFDKMLADAVGLDRDSVEE